MEQGKPDWVWRPGVGVGAVTLGHDVSGYLDVLGLRLSGSEHDGTDEWCEYESTAHEIRLLTCNGVIVTISCDREFIHAGRNVIGMAEEVACAMFDCPSPTSSDAGLGHFLDYEAQDLQLLVMEGVVAIVSVGIDPDEVLEESDNQ